MLNTKQQNRLSSLSFKEKSNALNIITILLTYGYYFSTVLYGGDPLNANHIATLIGVTLVFIVVQISGQSILAAIMPKEAKLRSSELGLQTESKAYKSAYIVLGTGVFTALMLSLVNMPTFWIFQNIVFFFVLAELTKFISEIMFLRRRFVAQP